MAVGFARRSLGSEDGEANDDRSGEHDEAYRHHPQLFIRWLVIQGPPHQDHTSSSAGEKEEEENCQHDLSFGCFAATTAAAVATLNRHFGMGKFWKVVVWMAEIVFRTFSLACRPPLLCSRRFCAGARDARRREQPLSWSSF
ncbi:hypothetical protein ACLOJK_004854 [Asimina triloba]